MRYLFLFIFIPVIILTGNAQDTLRKRISLFGQAGYNRPLNFSTISSSPDKKQEINYYYKNGFSIGAGISHSIKKLTLSWLAHYTYVSGKINNVNTNSYGSFPVKADFTFGKLSAELLVAKCFGKNKRLALGAGIALGTRVHCNLIGTQEYWDYFTNKKDVHYFGNEYFSKGQHGFLVDAKYLFQKTGKPNFASIGIRAYCSNGIVPYANTFIKSSFNELEFYAAYNLAKPPKRLKDSTSKSIYLRPLLGTSYFLWGGYNKPFNYTNKWADHAQISSYFAHSAGIGIGISKVKEKFGLFSMLSYVYAEGNTEGEFNTPATITNYSSDFYQGKLRMELIISKAFFPKRKFYTGIGLIAGRCIYQNISGQSEFRNRYPNVYPPVLVVSEITKNDYRPNFIGLILDLKYALSSFATYKTSYTIGTRISTLSSTLPNVYFPYGGQQELEIYITYHILKKKKMKPDSQLNN